MSWRNFDTIYTNGCSTTAGGGLYFGHVINEYVDKYSISRWKNERDVSYPKYVSKHFDCELIDDSQCGSGAPRLIRTTYEFINKIGLEKAKKTLFLFQINNPFNRIDLYNRRIEDYVIVNIQYYDDFSHYFFNMVDKHSPNETKFPPPYFNDQFDDVLFYLNNFHSPLKYNEKNHNDLIGLFGFLDLHGIEYFYGYDCGDGKRELLNENRRINVYNCETINRYSELNNMKIDDDLKPGTDGHPGYFAHKKWAEGLCEFLEEKLKPTLWVFGDSYSAESHPIFDPSNHLFYNDFRVKYSKYKGYYPKTYPEIVAEELDLNLVNLAVPSYSNDNIFHSFINVAEKIKPNDILFFGWTYNTRFNIANDKNELSNINITRDDDETIEGGVSMKAKNEMLVNRTYTIFYHLLNNYLKIIKLYCGKNIILNFNFPGKSNDEDLYLKKYQEQISFIGNVYEKIKDETNDNNFNGHYSEKGHKDFAKDIIEKIEKIWKKGKKISSFMGIRLL
jgi:hypothetical protein